MHAFIDTEKPVEGKYLNCIRLSYQPKLMVTPMNKSYINHHPANKFSNDKSNGAYDDRK